MNVLQNIYQAARMAAGLTQERAAEALTISVESLRLYETDRRVPPNCIVARMSDLYNTQYLIIQHVRQADDLARSLLPDTQQRPLEQVSMRLYRLVRDFVQRHRTDCLLYTSFHCMDVPGRIMTFLMPMRQRN